MLQLHLYNWHYAKIVLSGLLFCTLPYIIKKSRFIFSSFDVVIQLPCVFSSDAKQEIHDFCTHNITMHGNQYIQSIATQFPFLTDIQTHIVPHIKRLYISGELDIPVCRVNHTILFQNNSTVTINMLEKEAYENLPVIIVPRLLQEPIKQLTVEEITLFKKLPFNLLKPYTIVWNDMTDAYLYPKNSDPVSLRFHGQSIPTTETMRLYQFLCQEYEQPSSPKKKTVHWIADVRFEKQIIVSIDKQKRG